MEGILRVDTSPSFTVSHSANSFLPDDVASTCPLLTPSPPTNALVNLAANPEPATFICAQELASKLQGVEDDNNGGGDSVSSSSSAEPACTQLLTGNNNYLHITKDEETAAQETNGKAQTLQMTFRNPPDNYFFMKWNWPLIRKLSTWLFLSGLVAMVGIVIAMVWTLPKTCNPPTEWYQGKLMYEIFPASFSDSNNDGIGDLRGITYRLGYLDSLGVKTIRLNSIFRAWDYPENFENITSLTELAPQLGNLTDLTNLVSALHAKNMYIIIDLPVNSLQPKNVLHSEVSNDSVLEALTFWITLGIDGFYLKGLEAVLEVPNIVTKLRSWRKIIGHNKAFIVSSRVIEVSPVHILNTVLYNVDLVDYLLQMSGGVEVISGQIESVLNGTLFAKAGNPWVLWSLGNSNTERLSNILTSKNGTLGALLLQLMLPGTPSIFYGDEISLQQVSDPHDDRKRLSHLHQLTAMAWEYRPFTRKAILPWLHGEPIQAAFNQVEVISKMVALRLTSPSIYINALNKDGTNKANAEIKYKENDLLVMQRWYPRRKSYVVVSNLGCVHISADLSTLLYSGEVVVGPSVSSRLQTISFRDISLYPGESVIVLLS